MLRLPGYLHGETSRNLSTRLTKHKQAMRNGDVNNHIAENHLQMKHQINWDSVTCITYSTDYYQRLTLHSWFTNLEQMPLSCSQQLPEYKRLIDEIKEKLTMREWLENWKWLTKDDCLTVTKDRSKHTNYITSLRSPKHQGLTDRRQITSSCNWPIRSITRV